MSAVGSNALHAVISILWIILSRKNVTIVGRNINGMFKIKSGIRCINPSALIAPLVIQRLPLPEWRELAENVECNILGHGIVIIR